MRARYNTVRAPLAHSEPVEFSPAGFKEAETRRLSGELRETRAHLEQFTWALSHDLKEPLRLVSSYAQLLIRGRENSLDPDEIECVEYIRGGVARAHALIDGLVIYAESARGASDTAGVAEAGAIAAEAARTFAAGIQETRAAVTIQPLPAARVNSDRLFRIFQNLIENALKFRKPGESPRIEISAVEMRGEIRFAVQDNGIGIRREHRERIFTLFQRLHGGEYPGIGLGLAVCKKLVESSGGRIWVQSQPGLGSTFFFMLPPARSSKPPVKETRLRALDRVAPHGRT